MRFLKRLMTGPKPHSPNDARWESRIQLFCIKIFPQRCPILIPKPMNRLRYMARRIQVADRIKIANLSPLNKEPILDYPGGQCNHWDP